MLILDENISEIEVWRLREWRIAVRQIGPDLAEASTTDENILPILHHLKAPTFFTRDRDFWNVTLRHRNYCVVFVDIPEHEGEVASAIRRFLGQQAFRTNARRQGKVVRIHQTGIQFWQVGSQHLQSLCWDIP